MNTYLYLKTSTILNEKYKVKKTKNPSFSMRSWAAQMGLKSHGALQQILAGKRSVPKKYIPLIAKSLDLTTVETLFFETLVDYEKAKSQEEKDLYQQRLNLLNPKRKELSSVEVENYKYFQNPLHSIIRTMIERKDFKNDPQWIKNKLRIHADVSEIKDVMERLVSLGLVNETEGKLHKTHQHIKNKIDVPSSAVQAFHRKMSLVASEEIKNQTVNEREFNSFCFNIKEEKLAQAKVKMREFINEFLNEFEAQKDESKSTYHLNLQLFSLTKENGDI